MNRAGCLQFLLALASLALVSTGAWVYHLAPIRNPAVEFGYYGRFHKVQRVISGIPGVRIVDHWKHEDVVLEDFGFTVAMDGQAPRRIDFLDGSAIKENGDDGEIRAHVLAELQRPAAGADAPSEEP